MTSAEFRRVALSVGFNVNQAKFLDEALAKHPHSHEIEDVEGLPETLEELGVTDAEEDEEEEEAEEEEAGG